MDILRIHHTGNAERSKRSRMPRMPRMPRMMKGDVGMLPPPRRMRIRLGPGGVVDVEGLSLRLLSRVSLLPLLSTVEEGNAERRRMGTGDVEGLLLRLLSRGSPLPLLLTVEEGNVDFPRTTFSPSQSSRMRMSLAGVVDVEGLLLRLLSRGSPLP